MPMKRRKRPVLHRQPQSRTVPRPTCCANCQTLYDQVHADLATLGPSPFAVDPGALYEALQQRRPCLLCGDPEICHGQLFLPQRINWREGAILYFLCTACLALPTPVRSLRVEAAIMAGLVGRRN